ncbi:MAG: hemolysin family protein [Myxococcota bacterium]|nr:hemolysin family protein [Myxococcota bacterium]
MLLALAIIAVLVTSFFCSLSEASLLSLGRARAETLASQSKAGRLLRSMKNNLERPIAAILILNTISNTGGAAIAAAEFRKTFGDSSMLLFSVFLTCAVLLFSEIIPKSIGVKYAESSALLVSQPLHLLMRFLRPVTELTGAVTRSLGMSSNRKAAVSLDDLRAMARLAASAKVLGREELMIIEAASQLPRVPIRNIMIHKEDIVYFSLAEEPDANMVKARRSLHSRLPVCRTDLSDVIGLVNMKEILWRIADEPEDLEEEGLNRIIGEALRDPLYAKSSIDVSDLIQLFSTNHEHMAIVVDDDKNVIGIVTLEDVIEELMGEIDDEFDRAPDAIEHKGHEWWRIGGGAMWHDVQNKLAVTLEQKPDADLDGRLDMNDITADLLPGRLRTGATFSVGSWAFRVVRMRRGKVIMVDAYGATRVATMGTQTQPPERVS